MRSRFIVKPEIIFNSCPGFPWRAVFLQVYVLIFQAPPEPFAKDVVDGSPTAVHTDFNAFQFQPFGVKIACEMGSLTDLESKVLSMIIVIMGSTFLQHFVRWKDPSGNA